MSPKLTRIRVEANADNEEELRCFLLNMWENVREGDQWESETQEYVPSSEGFWGRLTMRRKKESNGTIQ